MAKVKVEMPEEFLRKLSLLGSKTDEIAGRVLEAGGEVVLAKVRSNLSSVIGSGTKYDSRSTGELERSLGLTPPLVDRDGNHNIKVGFAEPRSDGGSNAMLANIIEYGKNGQPAKPFQTRPGLVPEGLYQRHDPQAGRGGGEAVSLLSELKTVADTCAIPVETGVFSGVPPDLYLVITPMVDTFALHADDSPGYDTQEARLSLFVKGSYTAIKDTLVRALLGADFCITDRRYIAHEDDTGFHHYAIDVAKLYQL